MKPGLLAALERAAPVAVAMLAGLTAWAAAWSWAPLYADPGRYLGPGAVAVVLIAAVGLAGRSARMPVALTLLGQLVAAGLVVLIRFAEPAGAPGVLPTPARLNAVALFVADGARQINEHAAPVPGRFAAVAAFLLVCLLALALAVDLLACSLRRVPLAGLPVLLGLTVPISVLDPALSRWVFAATGAGFLALLAVEHTRSVHGWGRDAGGARPADRTARLSTVAGGIGGVTLVGALLAPIVIPVTGGLLTAGPGEDGSGRRGVALTNPMIDMRRNLIRQTHTPLLDVRTDDPSPTYVQLTVLDEFTGAEWRAADRQLPAGNQVAGAMPIAPGISPTQPGRVTHWDLRISDTFETDWLPVPTPSRVVEVPGDWRYDSRTLDIADVDTATPSRGVEYRVEAFDPTYDANELDAAGTPVGQAVKGMTDLPSGLPKVIGRVAERVTTGASTRYQQAVALQDWFRGDGGFTYSTEPAPGSGMSLIAQFVTTDRIGYCEQFAAAMAVMARTLDIPARVVVGFLAPTGDAVQRGHRLFTSDDLHAWPELYFAGSGWVRFEPTPSDRSGAPPAYTTQQLTPDAQQTVTPEPTPTEQPRQKPPVPLPETGNGAEGGSTLATALGWGAAVLLIGGIALTPRWLRGRQRRHRLASADAASGTWAELRATAIDHQLAWADGRSPRQALAALRGRVTSDRDLVRELGWYAGFVEQARYGRPGAPVEDDAAARARAVVSAWAEAIREAVSPRAARRARWLPASLGRSRR